MPMGTSGVNKANSNSLCSAKHNGFDEGKIKLVRKC